MLSLHPKLNKDAEDDEDETNMHGEKRWASERESERERPKFYKLNPFSYS